MNKKKKSEKFVRNDSSLKPEQKKWLIQESAKRGISKSELERDIYQCFVDGTFVLPKKN